MKVNRAPVKRSTLKNFPEEPMRARIRRKGRSTHTLASKKRVTRKMKVSALADRLKNYKTE